jgi:hypothetical protein
VQLLFNPFVDAHGRDTVDFPRARSECQPVQSVHSALTVIQARLDRRFLILAGSP